jgi:hypothetical protein
MVLLVIPAQAGIHGDRLRMSKFSLPLVIPCKDSTSVVSPLLSWPWIPAYAGMTAKSFRGDELSRRPARPRKQNHPGEPKAKHVGQDVPPFKPRISTDPPLHHLEQRRQSRQHKEHPRPASGEPSKPEPDAGKLMPHGRSHPATRSRRWDVVARHKRRPRPAGPLSVNVHRSRTEVGSLRKRAHGQHDTGVIRPLMRRATRPYRPRVRPVRPIAMAQRSVGQPVFARQPQPC